MTSKVRSVFRATAVLYVVVLLGAATVLAVSVGPRPTSVITLDATAFGANPIGIDARAFFQWSDATVVPLINDLNAHWVRKALWWSNVQTTKYGPMDDSPARTSVLSAKRLLGDEK